MAYTTRREHLSAIFAAALQRVDPYRMLMDHVRLQDTSLCVDLDGSRTSYDLSRFSRVFIVGAGKATAPMALAMERILGDRLNGGVISVKYGHTEELEKVEIIEAGHPVPDENGLRAAEKMLSLAAQGDEKTLFISLISGGGSALLPAPVRYEGADGSVALTLDDKQKATSLLLACGADIEEINCIRKHLSRIKGGRLLAQMAPARSLNFILSDVVGDNLSSIASGATCADPTTFADAQELLRKYGIEDKVPHSVSSILARGVDGEFAETLKENSPELGLTSNILIGTNQQALDAARIEAEKRGYRVVQLTSRIVGEAREVGKVLAAIAFDSSLRQGLGSLPLCILSGGEPVVQLKGQGKGGRNQEMALAFLIEMARNKNLCDSLTFLAASTDGNDGPTDAAGAFADLEIGALARKMGLNPSRYLEENDSYHFFEKCEGLLKTGPTNTNVCDLHISLIDKAVEPR